jgi:acetate kinase
LALAPLTAPRLLNILVVNLGSSSLKCAFFRLPQADLPEEPLEPEWKASVGWGDLPGTASARIARESGESLERALPLREPIAALEAVLPHLWSGPAQAVDSPADVDGVGHRVVHGGDRLRESTRITPDVRRLLADLADLAPAHNASQVQGIDTAVRLLGPGVPQFAVLDTAFHSTLPAAAFAYPLPHEWLERGIRRYGFHGISHKYASERTARLLGKPLESLRIVTCHLGSGCSLAAVADGKSLDTTMGFTPMEGLMMATRSGSVDAGILLHTLRHGVSAEALDDILNRRSGLKGLSGLSGDMRLVLAAREKGDTRAALAFEVYVHRLRGGIGSMVASLGGADVLTFTGGVGENAAPVRAAACDALECFGLRLDEGLNAAVEAGDRDIATADSRARILVVHAREEWAIASEAHRLLRPRAS